MKYPVAFLTLGAVCAVYATLTTWVWLRLLLASCAAACVGVGCGYGWLGPRVFGKKPTGEFPPAAYALFWPYLLLNTVLLAALRWGKEPAFDCIVPGLYLGRRLGGLDRARLASRRFHAVLDLTSEFPAPGFTKRVSHYHCIPLLDTRAPTVAQLSEAAAFIRRHRAEGEVYVHCALGHGRSALCVAAYLVTAGYAATPEEAERQVRARRAGVELHACQRRILREYVDWLRRDASADSD